MYLLFFCLRVCFSLRYAFYFSFYPVNLNETVTGGANLVII